MDASQRARPVASSAKADRDRFGPLTGKERRCPTPYKSVRAPGGCAARSAGVPSAGSRATTVKTLRRLASHVRPLAAVILFASLLAAGCLGEEVAEPAAAPEEVQTDDASLRPIVETFSGSVSGTPVAAGESPFEFTIPQGAIGLNGTLLFEPAQLPIDLTLIDPNGEVVETGYPAQDGMLIVATVEPPMSGTWTYLVTSESPVPVSFTLEAVAELLVPQDNEVVKTVQLGGGAGFYEVNVIMEENATFTFAFNASQPINWDVHSHPPEGVKYWERGTDASAAGTFTAPARGIYSLLFHNENALPADVTFEMRGAFRLHSHAQ